MPLPKTDTDRSRHPPMSQDMMQMQREAARRVSRMQEHSRRVFEEHNGRTPTPPVPPRDAQAAGFTQPTMRSPGLYTRYTPPADDPPAVCPTAVNEECGRTAITPPRPAHQSTFDGEQWLLLGLALLLFRSGCRPELAIALLYLAM